MNNIKISGRVISKTKEKNNSMIINVLLAVPIKYRIYNDGVLEQNYNYLSFKLIGKNFSNLRKGSYVDIVGYIIGNSDENGNLAEGVFIVPSAISKGVVK